MTEADLAAGTLAAVLLVVAAPAWLLVRRFGWPRGAGGRFVLGAALTGLVVAAMPWNGVDYAVLKRFALLIASATALLLWLEARGVLQRATRRRWLLPMTIFSVLVWANFSSFRGEHTFVHYHDVAHYYLGAKYFDELRHADLYTAMLRAEAESTGDRFRAIEARDLATNERVHIRELLQKSGPVKERFTPERWFEFRRDVELFRDRLGDQWGTVLLDHGFNPTPAWVVLGRPLAQRVPAGSVLGIRLLTLVDVALLVATFALVAWAFGVDTMLLATILFTLTFGATFGWTGGAFLRFPWFFGVVGGACLWRRQKHAGAGALVALAAATRVFPAVFVLPFAAKVAARLLRRKPPRRRHVRFLAGAAACGAALFLASLALPGGVERWVDFRANMKLHLANISPNIVGLPEVAVQRFGGPAQVTAEEFRALKERRQSIQGTMGWLVGLPFLAAALWWSTRRRDLVAFAVGLPILWVTLTLAAYYWVVLVLAVLVWRKRLDALWMLFAVEAASYALLLFDDRDGRLFFYRGILLGVLWLWLFAVPRGDLGLRRARRGEAPGR